MSAFSSDDQSPDKHDFKDRNRSKMIYNRNKKRLSNFYGPALMTK